MKTLADLQRAQALIRKIDDEIDPQFRINSPEGDYWVAMTFSQDMRERRGQLKLLSKFMTSKLSSGFTMACELYKPDAVFCFGATPWENCIAFSRIERKPLRFGKPEWLPENAVGDEVLNLLPRGVMTLDAPTLLALHQTFGPRGKFPAIPIGPSAFLPPRSPKR